VGRRWKVKIVNIVATSRIGDNLDLYKISRLDQVKYNPKAFPGAVLRITRPKASILIFESGRVVCSGTKCLDDAEAAVKKAAEIIGKAGFDVGPGPVKIQNIVASADFGSEINLNALAVALLGEAEYEPEQFPGLIYRISDPRSVVLIFSSGKVVIAGCKDEESVVRAAENVYNILSSMGLV
jgi:transcription initiation factor TFIID TATA-box-binding protein